MNDSVTECIRIYARRERDVSRHYFVTKFTILSSISFSAYVLSL